jgi:ribosome maturation factor RimP
VGAVERVRELVEPLVKQQGAELYDIEHESGILRIMVDRPEGIDVDTLGDLSQVISHALDVDDPVPDSRYLLEVTSPGVERRLRHPQHFQQQIGEQISVKLKRNVEGDRRFEGRVKTAGEASVELDVNGEVRQIAYSDIDMARVIYDWSKDFADKAAKTDNSIAKKKASTR